jgi:hypothetical protein
LRSAGQLALEGCTVVADLDVRKPREGDIVGVGDTPVVNMDEGEYRKTRKKTRVSTRELNGVELPETATFILEPGSFPTAPREPAA